MPDFDLNPDPRILVMLGEINLSQERCLAELIDNSVDGFLKSMRDGSLNYDPEVHISLPSNQSSNARITIVDNGPGMKPEVLERAVRAGWTNNDPIQNLGLFGMGFNIATARLGRQTTVWTSQSGDTHRTGLVIDFDELIKNKSFKTPVRQDKKSDPAVSGTTIEISRLKTEQVEYFTKSSNVSKCNGFLSRIYSSMLVPNGKPIYFHLFVNTKQISGKRHCLWSGERQVQNSTVGAVNAIMEVNSKTSVRPFCKRCWSWAFTDQPCPQCGTSDQIEPRNRSIRGWVGIQRYLDQSDYGIDLIRNGRKIEIANKDLFYFDNDGEIQKEYPIDDHRERGRIVGEIHLDHCRVSYTKDKFDRNDPAWQEMVAAVKGEGPLRPELAANLGHNDTDRPLYKLYQAFRRSSPHKKTTNCWSRILIVQDNVKAKEYAKYFEAGDAKYQTDEEWFKLIQQDEAQFLKTQPDNGNGGNPGNPQPPIDPLAPPVPSGPDGIKTEPDTLHDSPMLSLSGEYTDDVSHQSFVVKCFQVSSEQMPKGMQDEPLHYTRLATGEWEFYINQDSSFFDSITNSYKTALVSCLANIFAEMNKANSGNGEYIRILSSLRTKYCNEESIILNNIVSRARDEISSISTHLKSCMSAERAMEFYKQLTQNELISLVTALADNAVDMDEIILSKKFIDYAPAPIFIKMFRENAASFFNGNYWDEKIKPTTTPDDHQSDLREKIIRKYIGYIEDAFWAKMTSTEDYDNSDREYKIRVAMSIFLMGKAK